MTKVTKHPSENEIESALLRHGEITGDQCLALARHLEECSFCSDIVEALRAAHDALMRFEEIPLPREAQFGPCGKIEPAGRIYRIEMHPAPRHTTLNPHAAPVIVLAAQDAGSSRRYMMVRSYTTEDEHALLRILADNSRGGALVQLIGDDSELAKHALVAFEGIPGYFPTDGTGEFREPDIRAASLVRSTAWVLLPQDRFEAGCSGNAEVLKRGYGALTGGAGARLDCSADEESGSLRLFYTPPAPGLPEARAILLTSAGSQSVFELVSGTTRAPKALLADCELVSVF